MDGGSDGDAVDAEATRGRSDPGAGSRALGSRQIGRTRMVCRRCSRFAIGIAFAVLSAQQSQYTEKARLGHERVGQDETHVRTSYNFSLSSSSLSPCAWTARSNRSTPSVTLVHPGVVSVALLRPLALSRSVSRILDRCSSRFVT